MRREARDVNQRTGSEVKRRVHVRELCAGKSVDLLWTGYNPGRVVARVGLGGPCWEDFGDHPLAFESEPEA